MKSKDIKGEIVCRSMYGSVGELSERSEVENIPEILAEDDGGYCCVKRVKISARIAIVGIINAEVEYARESCGSTDKHKIS